MERPEALSESEKKQLLQLAREAIVTHLAHRPLPAHAVTAPALLQPAGAFVTLWEKGRVLRGCVGRIEALNEPLYEVVQNCAISSATRDMRFSPVRAAEVADLLIEISVLTPPQPLPDPDLLEVGRHGIIIRQEEPYLRVGLLLPQVATERDWDRLTFLQAVCHKAGLPDNAWRTAKLFVFECEVFEERPV